MELVIEFTKHGLRARSASHPFAVGPDAHLVFGLDIWERDTDAEEIYIWPGEGADVQVLAGDAERQQVVLSVEEPERTFQDRWRVWNQEDLASEAERRGARVISFDGRMALVELKTTPARRHFLVGQDETHYFVCQLPRLVASVADAHEALRPPEAARQGTVRQGEWFFVPLAEEEAEAFHRALAANELLTRPNGVILGPSDDRGMFPTENPHAADRLVWNPWPLAEMPRGTEFVCGVVRQAPRHRPLDLGVEWHRVVRNLEVPNAGGVTWYD